MSESSCSSYSDRGFHMDDRPYKGPTKNRSCTDAYCLFVFVGFIIGWAIVAYYAYWNGDIDRLYTPTDSDGQLCGVDPSVKNKKYLAFFDIAKCVTLNIFLFGCPTRQICVADCPKENWFSDTILSNPPTTSKEWTKLQDKLLCISEDEARKITSLETFKESINKETCAPYYIHSAAVFGKLCLPDFTSKIETKIPLELVEVGSNSVKTYFYTFFQTLQIVQRDLEKCWHLIALLIGASTLACLFFIIIMGILAKLMVWITLLIIIGLLCFCTVSAYVQYKAFDNNSTVTTTVMPDGQAKPESARFLNTGFWLHDEYENMVRSREFWSILTIVCGCVAVMLIILIIFLRKRINLAVMIIREGSKAVNDIKTTLVFPIIPILMKLVVIAWFLWVFGFLKTLGNSVYTISGLQNDTDCVCSGINYKEDIWCLPHQFDDHCHSKTIGLNSRCVLAACKFVQHRSTKLIYGLFAYNFFAVLWAWYFVSGFGRVILAYCFSLWYWTLHKKNIPYFTVLTSLYVSVRYHLGTIAVGSFLIATLSFIRSIIEYLHRNLKGRKNVIFQCIFWSLQCCFWILQKFLTFVTSNAYTMCAIYGEGFCSSAQSAVGLLLRNIVRVAVLDKVVDFLILMGKIGLTVGMGLMSHYTFTNIPLSYPIVPIAIVVLITWIVASTFFSVYTVAVDTLFLCFLKDGEMNDGSQEKPYYMSPNLKYVMNKNLRHRKKRVTPHSNRERN